MKTLLFFVFIGFILASVAWLVFPFIKSAYFQAKGKVQNADKGVVRSSRSKMLGVIIPALCLVFSIFGTVALPAQLYTVDAGEVAVVKKYGEIDRVERPGLHFKNFISETYEIYSTQTQEIKVEKECYSSDLQAIHVTQIIQFRIQVEKVMEISRQYGDLETLKVRVAALSYEAIEESAKSFGQRNW